MEEKILVVGMEFVCTDRVQTNSIRVQAKVALCGLDEGLALSVREFGAFPRD